MKNNEKTYILKGREDNPKLIQANNFISILCDDKYEKIEIEYATIEGDFDITRSKLKKVKRPWSNGKSNTIDRYIIHQEINISNTTFSGNAGFAQAEFKELVDFRGVKFKDGHFQNSDFKYLTFFGSAEFEGANFWGAIFRETVSFRSAKFKTIAPFMDARFEKNADFIAVLFTMIANFQGAVFHEWVDFGYSLANGVISFDNTKFLGKMHFYNIKCILPADFSGVIYLRDNITQWWKEALWNCYIPDYSKFYYRQVTRKASYVNKIIQPVRPYLKKVFQPILRMFGLNDENTKSPTLLNIDPNIISEITPQFKRYVKEHLFLRDVQNNNRFVYRVWRWTCDCGRSIFLWTFWSLLIIIVFGLIYADFSSPNWMPQNLRNWLDFINPIFAIEPPIRKPTLMTYLYFSVVTFTTLGFGDIKPLNTAGEVFVMIEVIIGYIMLGGLISIFANKIIRR